MMSVTQKRVELGGSELILSTIIMYRLPPLRTIRFCLVVIECDAISLLTSVVAGNESMIHHCACADRGVRMAGRRRMKAMA